MILEIDFGNTRIKWRLRTSEEVASLSYAQDLDDFAAQMKAVVGEVRSCRIALVQSAVDQRDRVEQLIRDRFACPVLFASSTAFLAGVVNGYELHEQLGVDRWLALVAGYRLVSKACVVIDAGTAITSDFVSQEGVHLGGLISPGKRLQHSFLKNTTGLHAEGALLYGGPQRNTADCISSGVATLFKGYVTEIKTQAQQHLGDDFVVLLTGGDAAYMAALLPDAMIVDDLVFRGLGLSCPL